MKTSHSVFAGLAVALLPYVAAHGYVSSITIDGKKYDGPYIEEPGSFPIRAIKSIDPVMGTDSKDIRCGPGSKAASKHADARPGSELEVKWSGGGGQKWPHNAGPMLTYLARCADDDCTKFDAADARWFKIDEVGLRKDGKSWVQEDLMKGKPAKLTLPDTLAPGAYLLRHEVIALHEANKKGGAQFYPSCAQIKVSGEETGEPAEDELVDFPGAYKDTDKGILVNPWEVTLKSYVFPGPAIAAFVEGGASNASMSVSPSGTTMSGSPTGSMSQGAGFSSPGSSPETTGYTGGAGFSSDMGYSTGSSTPTTSYDSTPSSSFTSVGPSSSFTSVGPSSSFTSVGSSPSEGNGETTLDSTGNAPATTDMSGSPSAGTSASQSSEAGATPSSDPGATPSTDMFVSPSGDASGSPPSTSQSSPTAPTVPLPTHMIGGRDGSPEPASAPYCPPLSPESAYGPGSICYSTGIVDRALPHTSGVITLREQPTRTVYPFTTQSVVPSTWDELPQRMDARDVSSSSSKYVPALTGPGWKKREYPDTTSALPESSAYITWKRDEHTSTGIAARGISVSDTRFPVHTSTGIFDARATEKVEEGQSDKSKRAHDRMVRQRRA